MEVLGLPLHPLVVHAAVVLVPLACLGALIVAVSGRARRRYGWLTAAFGLAGAAAAVTARLSGEALFASIGGSPATVAHRTWGLVAPFPAIVLALAIPALLLVDRRATGRPGTAFWIAAVVTVAAAVTGLVLVGLAGHTGATAVWGR